MTTPLDAQVSVFPSGTNATPVETLPLTAVLQRIQDGTYQQRIEALRAYLAMEDGKRWYDDGKKTLPAFTPAGVFTRRANAQLTEASGLVHFDFDHPPNLAEARATLAQDPWIAYAFISPSGDGLKVAVWADGIVDDTTYKHAWDTVLVDYFERTYPDLAVANDKACKDIARLCFVSHDPELYQNPDALLYAVKRYQAPAPKPKPTRQTGAALPVGRRERYARQALDSAVQMIDASVAPSPTSPGTRHQTRLKAARLLGGYVAGGILSAAEARAALHDAVARNTDDLPRSMKTVEDGLAHGEAQPITLDQLEAERLDWLTTHRATMVIHGRPAVPNMTGAPQPWGTTGQQGLQPHAVVVTMSDVTEEATQWLWWPYIALGTVCILDGDPGVGKTLLMTQLAASISLGHPLPDQQGKPTLPSGGPAPTLLLSMEDSLTRTLKPRLVAAGADCTKIHALTSWCDAQGQEQIFTFEHLPFLEEAIETYHPRLVVIDPVTAYMGKMDIHRANEVQALMGKLTRLAERANCAIVCIRHPAKPGQHIGKAIHRGLGSVGFIGSARTALFAESHPTDSAKALLGQTKNNMERHGRTQIFTKKDGHFQWCGVSRISAEMLGGSGRGPDAHAGLEALFWLEYRLAGDLPWSSTDIQEEAEVEGFSKRTLYAASKRLGVVKKQIAGGWTWRLPPLADIIPTLSTIGVTGVTGATALTALTGASDSVSGEESPPTPDIPLPTPDTPDTPVAPVAPVAPVSAVVFGSPPLTADGTSAGVPGVPSALLDVGEWITPLSLDGVIIPAPSGPPPYRIDAIEHDEHAVPYARLDVGTYWPLAQCEPAAPPAQPEQEGVSAREEFKA